VGITGGSDDKKCKKRDVRHKECGTGKERKTRSVLDELRKKKEVIEKAKKDRQVEWESANRSNNTTPESEDLSSFSEEKENAAKEKTRNKRGRQDENKILGFREQG